MWMHKIQIHIVAFKVHHLDMVICDVATVPRNIVRFSGVIYIKLYNSCRKYHGLYSGDISIYHFKW